MFHKDMPREFSPKNTKHRTKKNYYKKRKLLSQFFGSQKADGWQLYQLIIRFFFLSSV
jgi:hypothetical protein